MTKKNVLNESNRSEKSCILLYDIDVNVIHVIYVRTVNCLQIITWIVSYGL